MMKNKILFHIGASLIVLCGCNDVNLNLDSSNLNYTGEGTAGVITGQLATSYNMLLSNNYFGRNYWGSVGCMDTDEGYLRNATNSPERNPNGHNITSSSIYLREFWKQIWRSNEAATDVISMCESVRDMNDNDRNSALGQALVLQAFNHYYAAINFGPVPIKNVATFDGSGTEQYERRSVKDVLQFALDNCRKAIPLLPSIEDTKTTATITKSAAEALSYRIALYMASHPDIRDVAKYDSIVKWSDKFITTGPNKLNTKTLTVNGEVLPAYARLFVNNMANNQSWDEENNPEGIWDVVFYCKSANSGIYANMGISPTQQMGRMMGVPCSDRSTSSKIGYCTATWCASNNLFAAYTDFNNGKDYPIGDLRRDWNIPTFCYINKVGDNMASGYSEATRFPYFKIQYPDTVTYDKEATILPIFESLVNGSQYTANVLDLYVEDGGSGYKDNSGHSTFSFRIDVFKGNSPTKIDPSVGAVYGYYSHSSSEAGGGYKAFKATNNKSHVMIEVVDGKIVKAYKYPTTANYVGINFASVISRGVGKWRREYETDVPPVREQDYTSCNIPVLRFADVLLMASEANLMASNGNVDKGLEYLNEVRRRAYGKDIYTKNDYVDFAQLTLQEIKDERLRELCFEGIRRYDLIRWGDYTVSGKENVVTKFLSANPNISVINYPILQMQENYEKYKTLPIPQEEISNSQNTMWQNAGW